MNAVERYTRAGRADIQNGGIWITAAIILAAEIALVACGYRNSAQVIQGAMLIWAGYLVDNYRGARLLMCLGALIIALAVLWPTPVHAQGINNSQLNG
jgi:hypothetical protein